MFGLIYKITNVENGKVYIGQTTATLRHRWGQHVSGKRSILWFAICKYGLEAFQVEQIDSAESREELDNKEKYWIFAYGSITPVGYNCSVGGNTSSGWHHSERYRQNLSKSRKGKKLPEWWRRNISLGLVGRPGTMNGRSHSVETRRKMSESKKALYKEFPQVPRFPSEETKRKMSLSHTGVRRDPVVRAKMSESAKTGWLKRRVAKEINQVS